MNELADKVAIITGGGYGIGKQIALKYGAAGAKIVIAARSIEPMKQTCAELERLGARAIQVSTDVSKEADCAKMAAETMKAFGRIDILVNNAGISGPTKRITDMSLAEWQETIDIDLTGTWLATRAVLPHDGQAARRQRHQHFVGRGPSRLSVAIAVRGGEVGDDRADANDRRRMGSARHPLQLHLSRRDRGRPHRTRDARAGRSAQAAVRTDQSGFPVAGARWTGWRRRRKSRASRCSSRSTRRRE